MTTGRGFFKATAGAPPHDWMNNMGGSIGLGLPLATGAAVACPDRKVVCLEGDGSGMYTLQALWTQAREGLDVTTVVFANRTYAILRHELSGVRAGTPGPKAADMLDIGRPDLDWVALARGMGVPASRATTAEEFNQQFAAGLADPRPLPRGGRAMKKEIVRVGVERPTRICRRPPSSATSCSWPGQTGRHPATGELGKDVREQTRNTLERIKVILAAAGTSLDNVLSAMTHLTRRRGPGRLQRGVREVLPDRQAGAHHRDRRGAERARAADRDHGHRVHPRLTA